MTTFADHDPDPIAGRAVGSYVWLVDLARWLAADPVLAPLIVEEPGWQTRGRPADQFRFRPSGVLDHHTACMAPAGHTGESCVRSIIAGRADAPGPISQILGTPPHADGWPRVHVIAAGRANHAGSGRVPWNGATDGNAELVGIEWCGPPARWDDRTIEVRARVTAAILRGLGVPLDHVATHWEYATPRGRKIDPSGPWHREPSLPQLSPWDPVRWRERVAAVAGTVPNPPNPQPELETETMFIMRRTADRTYHVADGIHRCYVPDPNALVWASAAAGRPLRDAATGRPVHSLTGDVSDVDDAFLEQMGVYVTDAHH